MLTANHLRFERWLRRIAQTVSAGNNGSGSCSLSREWKAASPNGSRLNRNLCLVAGTIAGFPRDPLQVTITWGSAVDGKQIRFQYESLTAELCLGMAVAGVSTLIGIGLVIVFA
jgi:hypothetical protein